MGYNNTSNMGYNIEPPIRDTLYEVPLDVKQLRSEILEKEKEKEKEKSRINNLIKKGYMSIEEAIKNSIKIGDRVIVRTKFNIFSKGVEGGYLTNISLTSGFQTQKPTMSIHCLTDECKNSQDLFLSKNTDFKSFGNDYIVKVISGPPPRPNGGKSNRKSKKFNRVILNNDKNPQIVNKVYSWSVVMNFQVEKDSGIIPQILTQILDGSINGITLSDPDQEDNPIVYANKAFEKITGYSKEETAGRNCRFLHDQDKDQEVLQQIRDAIKNARPVEVTLKNFRKNGELFYNRLSITPLFDNEGQLIYFLGVQYDVTEQILAQQQIKTLTDTILKLRNQ